MKRIAVIACLVWVLASCGGHPAPPPPPPSKPSVTVRWVDDDSSVLYFKVYRNGANIGSSSEKLFLDKSPIRGASSVYTVTAVNVAGESKQSEGSVATVP